MTTTSFKMKGHFIASIFLTSIMAFFFLSSCQKTEPPTLNNTGNNSPVVSTNSASGYSSDVLDKWMTLQLRLMRNATGIPNQAFSRHMVYSGIAALESLAPGLPANKIWSGKWNSLTNLPIAGNGVKFYYPANVNAAMASINKSMFPSASVNDKAAIDSLEQALNTEFLSTQDAGLITQSSNFGKAVATAIFNWAETDGYKLANAAYQVPSGPGLWVPTAPAFANPVSPYWGKNRPVIAGSIHNTQPPSPIVYSTDPHSDFYKMAKEVYDVSQGLTTDQKAMATFWRDVPGVTSPGHWLSIVQQVVKQSNCQLDKAAVAYALTGAAINDGLISCWQTKYAYNLVRPITYIRDVLGHSSWTPTLTTPAHPEYSSAHAVLSIAAAEILDKLFGNIGTITDHTYDYLGFSPRTYSSFIAIGAEASISRLYAGIHYRPSIEAGILQGRKVAWNILSYHPLIKAE